MRTAKLEVYTGSTHSFVWAPSRTRSINGGLKLAPEQGAHERNTAWSVKR